MDNIINFSAEVNVKLPREGGDHADGCRFPVRVYYEDTDAAGLVYYANYFKFAERARTEMLRQHAIEQEILRVQTGLVFVVRRTTAEFIQAARLDDELVVVTRIAALKGASVEFDQEIKRADVALVKLSFQIACLGRNGRAQRLPSELRNALSGKRP